MIQHVLQTVRMLPEHSHNQLQHAVTNLYRGSSMPYKGLKLMPVQRSTAAPRSMILTSPSAVMRMFSGLISRWTMPRACRRLVPFSVCFIRDLMISSCCFWSLSFCCDFVRTNSARLSGKGPMAPCMAQSSDGCCKPGKANKTNAWTALSTAGYRRQGKLNSTGPQCARVPESVTKTNLSCA